MRRVILSAQLLLIAFASIPVSAQEGSSRSPVPDAAATKKAMALVREVYQRDFTSAKTPQDRLKLSQRMLRDAASLDAKGADAFVAMRVARDVAIQAGSIRLASSAIDEIAKRYAVDAVAMKLSAALRVAKNAKSRSQRKELAEFALPLLDRAATTQQIKQTTQLASIAEAAARGARDLVLAKKIAEKAKKIKQLSKHVQQVTEATAKLKQNPDDPQANEIVGRFKCFVAGDWKGGLPQLAAGTDPALVKLAKLELKGADAFRDQLTLADGWWKQAQQQSGAAKKHLMQHAALWYQKARPQSKGLARVKLTKRLEAIQSQFGKATGSAAGPPVEYRNAKTKYVGRDRDTAFEDIAPKGAYLVGFRAAVVGTNVGAIQPIFRKGKCDVLGKAHGEPKGVEQSVVAKPNYAVAGLETMSGTYIDSFKVVFMRLTPDGLDPKDSYTSPRIGGVGGGPGTLTGRGHRVIGVHGYAGRYLRGIGLIVAEPVVEGWTVIFRSTDPTIWKKDHVKGDNLARSLESVPDGIRFLRMTMLSKKQQQVIVPMQKKELGQERQGQRFGWTGRGNKGWEGYHLGLFVAERNDTTGAVHVGSGNLGWGFGHIHHGNDTPGGYAQGYSWAGKRVKSVAFQIEVKSEELSEKEKRFLLK